jgi:hypothetical protein
MSSVDGIIPNPVTEEELAKRSTAPRVTEAEVLGSIAKKRFIVDGTLTICILTLHNGWQLFAESACADPANYNKEIGERISYDNAVKKIWQLLGFALVEKLHNTPKDFAGRLRMEISELGSKLEKLNLFIDGNGDVYKSLSEKEQHLMIDQRDVMSKYIRILADRIELI